MPKSINPAEVLRVVHRCRKTTEGPDGQHLSAGAKHALLVLSCFYPNIRPPQERLAVEMGVSLRTVNRWLRELEDVGLIERKSGRQHYATHYLLHPSLIPTSAAEPGDDDSPDWLLS